MPLFPGNLADSLYRPDKAPCLRQEMEAGQRFAGFETGRSPESMVPVALHRLLANPVIGKKKGHRKERTGVIDDASQGDGSRLVQETWANGRPYWLRRAGWPGFFCKDELAHGRRRNATGPVESRERALAGGEVPTGP
jgi:hypothetical protein